MIEEAFRFACCAHLGQKRKYTGCPYIEHPLAVAALVAAVEDDPEVVAAACLHDVVEDTPVSLEEIAQRFGARVAALVAEVTDVSRPQDGNRKVRKALDKEHLAAASPAAQSIKLADLIDNTSTIIYYDPVFAEVYMQEKRDLLKVLTRGNQALHDRATEIVEAYFARKKNARA